ncbi:MAG TPA: pyridoxamine 5'-phosphate oxidase family protein [Gemmatimonadaceae bacterium]
MSGQDAGTQAAAAEMPIEACHALLREGRVGMLAMMSEEGPYAIPMAYGWDGAELWIGVSEGLKTRLLDADPRCALTVWVADGRDSWRSVIVAGTAYWAATPEERMRGGEALRRQHGGGAAAPPPGPPPASVDTPAAGGGAPASPPTKGRFSGGRMLLVRDARITGRAKG